MNDTPIPASRTRGKYVFRIAALVLNRQPVRACLDSRPVLIVAAIGLMTIGTFQLFDDSRSAAAESTCASSIENPRSPGPPRNVDASFVNGSFRLSWSVPSDVGNPSLSGYRVYWDPNEPPLDELPTTMGRNVPQWKGIGTTHTISVAAVNCAGSSEQASVNALAAELPSAPRMFAVDIAGTFAIISWKSPASSGSARSVNGYVLTYETGGDSTTVQLARNIFEHILSGLTAGASYTFRLAAKSTYGTGAEVSKAATIPLPNDAPRSFSATYAPGQIVVTWRAPASSASITGYRLKQTVGGTTTTTDLSSSSVRHTVSSPSAGSSYKLRLAALTNGSEGTAVSASVTVPGQPGAPTGLSAEISDGDLVVTWSAPTEANRLTITGYEVAWAIGQTTGTATTAASVLRYTITSPSRGSTVDITVTAVSALGNGSAAMVSYTVPAPPSAPRNLALTMSGGNLQVSWSAPAQSGTASVSGFVLKWQYDNVASTVTLGSGALSHSITSPVAGKEYTVYLSATSAVGAGPTATGSITIPAAPGTPRNLSASVSGSSLTVSWSSPSYGGTSAITGYSLKWKFGTSQQSGSASLGAGGTSHTIASVTAGATYAFSLTASNSVGAGTAATLSYTVPSPPGKPRDLDAEIQSNGDFRVSWKSPTYAGTSPITKYRLSWTVGGSSAVSSIETTALRHDITSPSLGSTYAFDLVAINAVGSGPSATLNAVVPSPPGKVTNLAAEMSGTGLAVSWGAPTYAGTTALTGYLVSWATGSTPTSKSLGATATAHTIPEVVQGSTYTVTVAAKNSVGNGASSSVEFTVPQPPGTPRNFTAEMSGGALVLAWQAPTVVGTSAVSGYTLSWTVDAVTTTENLLSTARRYSIASPALGKRYQFSLRAVSAAGTGHNADVSFTVPQPPGAPTNLTASVDANGRLKVAWSAPAAAVTPAIKHYALSWTVTGSTTGGSVQVGVTARTHAISLPTKGATYTFSVAGVSDAGTGPSATISFTVPKPPGAPRDLAAVILANGKLQVTWSAPTVLGTPTLSGYRLSWTVNAVTGSASKTANQRSHAISSPAAGATYSFTLISYNSGGDSPAATLDYTVPAVPGSPRDFAAAFGTGKVRLSWKNPTYAGVPALSGYLLSWSVRNPRTAQVARGSATLVATKRAHELTNAAAGSKYQFSLVARNSTGDSSSVTASVTVPSAPDAPRNLDAELETDGDLAVTWDAPAYGGTAPITGYKVAWAIGQTTESATTSASVLRHTISSPMKGSTVGITVAANSAVGEGPSATVSFTVPSPPSAPRDLSLTMSSGSLRVSWSPPAQVGTSAVTGYFLKWKYDSATNSARLGGSSRSHTITSPVAGKSYTVSLSATSSAGDGPATTASFTVPAVPGPPRNLSASVSGSSLTVSWSAPSYGGTSAITGYSLTWKFGTPQQSGSASLGAGDTSHTIASATAGATYTFSLTASNSEGAGTAATLSYTVPSPPGKPRDLDAEIQSDGDFRVSWKSPTYAGTSPITKYRLSWTVGGSAAVSSIETTALRHDITSPSLGSTYAFTLVAINAVGSGPSATLNAVVPSPPGKVSSLAAEMSGAGLAVSWGAPAYAGTTVLTGYILSWATGSTPASKSLSSATTVYTIPEVVQGSTYTVTVAAKNSVGSGASSSVEFTVPQPPGTPRNFTAEMSGGALVLAWQAPTVAGTSAISAYTLSWTADGFTTRKNLASTARGHSIASPTSGTRYQFSLRAVSAAGTGHNADISFTVPQPPGAPTNLTASVDANGKLKVAWSAPAAAVTPAIKHYALSWTVTGSTTGGSVQVGVTARTHAISLPTKGATYTFSVAGVSDAGTGPSATISFTVPKPPGAPRELAAVILANGKLQVSWSAPTDLGTPTLSGYRVSWTVDGTTGSATKAANKRSHAISSPVAGATYSFSVISYNSGGDSPAATLDYTVPAVPGSPRDFAAEFGAGKVTASWKNPTFAGVPALSGYVLTWSIQSPRTDHVTRGSASLTASKRAHALADATAGAKYQFSLVARNSTGDSESVTASVTVPSAPDAPRNLDAELETDGDLVVTWDAPEYTGTAPITGYALSWTVGGDTMSATTDAATTKHTISSPDRGSRYHLSVKATNSVGDSTAATNYVVVPAPPDSPMDIAWEIVTNDGVDSLRITWDAPGSSGTSSVKGYVVQYTVGEVTAAKSLGATARSYTIDEPVPGGQYAIKLSVQTNDGMSAATLTFTYPKPPDAPRAFTAKLDDSGNIALTWNAPLSSGTSLISGYELTVNVGTTTSPGDVTSNNRLIATARTHTIADPVAGKTYRFGLAAVSNAGKSRAAEATLTIPEVPGMPRALAGAIDGNGDLVITWTAPANRTESALSGYALTWRRGSEVGSTSVADASSPRFELEDPVTGSTYDFAIKSVGPVGESGAATLSVTIPAPPGAPRDFAATVSSGEVILTWNAPANAGTSELQEYKLSWSIVGDESAESRGNVTLEGAATSYTIDSPRYGSTYAFELRAVTGDGTGPAVTMRYRVPTVPGLPSSLSASYADGTTTLRWDSPVSDGGIAVTGYEVSWEPITGTGYGSVDSDQLSFAVPGTQLGIVYRFAVVARNAVGRGPIASLDYEVSTSGPSGKTFDDNPPQLPLNFSATFVDGVARFAWRTPDVVVGNPVISFVLAWSATNHDHFATVELPADAVNHELLGLRRGAEYSISLVVVRRSGTQSPIARFFTVPDLQYLNPASAIGPVATVATILVLREHRLPRQTVRITPSRWLGPVNLEIYQQGESVQVYWNEPEGREPLGWTVDWVPDPPDFPPALPGSSRNYGILGTQQAESRVVKVRAVYSDGLSSRAKATLSFSPDISARVAPRSDMLALAHGFGTQAVVQGYGVSARVSAPADGMVQGDRVKLKLTFALMPRIRLEGYMPECDEMSLKVEAAYAPVRKRADSEATRYRMFSPLEVCLTDTESGLGIGDAVSSVVLATRSGSAEVLDSETVSDGEQAEVCATVGMLELGEPMYFGLVSRDATDTMDPPALEVQHGFSAFVLLFVNWMLATTRRRW